MNVGLLALFGAPATHWPALWADRIVSTACFAGGAFVLALAGLLPASEPLREQLRGITKATLVCTALSLPWFAGALIYPGSPVPHAITAKMGVSDLQGGAVVPAQTSIGQALEAGVRSFAPLNFSFGGWPDWVRAFALGLAGEDPRIRRRHEIVKVFDVREAVNAVRVQGHPFLLVDARFLILRKR